MAVALGDLDALVFTGGAGEGSARLRADVCAGLGLIGVAPIGERGAPVPLPGDGDGEPDPDDRVVSGLQSRAAVLVVHAREDLEIARAVRELLSS
jgi:acetate kinase